MIEFLEELYQPRIMLSGKYGGTGASTTAKELHKVTDLSIISGGKYFRGLAREFLLFQAQHLELNPQQQYLMFLALYEELFRTDGLNGVSKMIQESVEAGADGLALDNFQGVIDAENEASGKVTAVWDHYIDQKTLSEALKLPGFIWESKLAVLALHLDQLKVVVPDEATLAYPYLSVLLELPVETAAEWIGKREARFVDVAEVLRRKTRDFDRYGPIYSINGRNIEHDDLTYHANVRINTDLYSPAEVTEIILREYMTKITGPNQHPVYAYPLIQNLNHALSRVAA